MTATVREKSITVRLAPETYEVIRGAADREMRTVSNFLEFHGLERARSLIDAPRVLTK